MVDTSTSDSTIASLQVVKIPDTSSSGVAAIRLRGVTPASSGRHAKDVQYSIDLGQQKQRKEAIEWLVTFENCSDHDEIPFSVSVDGVDGNGQAVEAAWVLVGQSRGVLQPGGSSSVMLYFLRAVVGTFKAFVIVTNEHIQHAPAPERQRIQVTMDVITEPRKSKNMSLTVESKNMGSITSVEFSS